MSLAEFPLYLIPITSVEVGLSGDDGLGILFTRRGYFAFNVHDERSMGVEAVKGGRAGGLGEAQFAHCKPIYPEDTIL